MLFDFYRDINLRYRLCCRVSTFVCEYTVFSPRVCTQFFKRSSLRLWHCTYTHVKSFVNSSPLRYLADSSRLDECVGALATQEAFSSDPHQQVSGVMPAGWDNTIRQIRLRHVVERHMVNMPLRILVESYQASDWNAVHEIRECAGQSGISVSRFSER